MHKVVIFTIKFIISFCTKYKLQKKNQNQSLNKHLCPDFVLRALWNTQNNSELKNCIIAVLRLVTDTLTKYGFIKRQRNPSAAQEVDMTICFKSWLTVK